MSPMHIARNPEHCSPPNRMTLAIRSLRSARKLVLAVSRQPENAVASYSPTSALPPLHSRNQQTSIQHEIASVRASPRNPDRHLPALVLLAVISPVLPGRTCD